MVSADPIPAVAVYVAGGGMAAAITGMWLWVKTTFKDMRSKLKDCEDDREELWKRVTSLTGEAAASKTCPEPKCPIRLAFPHRSVAAKQQAADGS